MLNCHLWRYCIWLLMTHSLHSVTLVTDPPFVNRAGTYLVWAKILYLFGLTLNVSPRGIWIKFRKWKYLLGCWKWNITELCILYSCQPPCQEDASAIRENISVMFPDNQEISVYSFYENIKKVSIFFLRFLRYLKSFPTHSLLHIIIERYDSICYQVQDHLPSRMEPIHPSGLSPSLGGQVTKFRDWALRLYLLSSWWGRPTGHMTIQYIVNWRPCLCCSHHFSLLPPSWSPFQIMDFYANRWVPHLETLEEPTCLLRVFKLIKEASMQAGIFTCLLHNVSQVYETVPIHTGHSNTSWR